MDKKYLYKAFKNNGGILRTYQLNELGFYSRQINKLIENGDIVKIKRGFYELTGNIYPEEVVIARLFPNAVIFLESALMVYEYTDRIPSSWQIAVDRNSEKNQYKIDYPLIDVFYMESKLLDVGVDINQIDGVDVKIFNRDRTMCDVLRHESKIEREVFSNAIQRYVKDPKKDIKKLLEYSKVLNLKNKVQTYIGVWL
ncbi:putative AbiEi antitoxin of type IV toxin-antitoxin system [Tissierella praeacuta]|uniref:type IV toxin-antitoxin system AbiEi family antitoxin domain-containing protein n=1 Tax=Tissierella praeacuta TaxID=43131 RepID=UPI0010F1AE51|nr:type IV toxin-antitoxin system AbiEi family antitoxin domain-containing protein [Tissierella praeacuta]TCU77262.1 putative AbiEi antitoxin of type IV toxin-antitoxin system [Tissierella praeacuta]